MTATQLPPPDPMSAAPTLTPPTEPASAGSGAAAAGPALPRLPGPASAPAAPTPPPRRGGSLVLLLAGLAIGMVVLVAAALPVLQGDDGGEPAGGDQVEPPSTSLVLRPEPTTAIDSTETAAPPEAAPVSDEATAADDAPVADATADAETVTNVPETAVATIPVVEVTVAVPESRAVVRGGQIFLEGAVPSAAAGEEIAALAAEVLGPDNVFNNYVVDPRASDPNLGNVTVEDTINFATGSAVLLPESLGLLNQAKALMTIRPSVTVIVVGHTDARGTDAYNLDLSRQRAEAVKTWLTGQGIDGSRLTVIGKGETEPIADNSTAEGQRLNRRIQFFLENLLADS